MIEVDFSKIRNTAVRMLTASVFHFCGESVHHSGFTEESLEEFASRDSSQTLIDIRTMLRTTFAGSYDRRCVLLSIAILDSFLFEEVEVDSESTFRFRLKNLLTHKDVEDYQANIDFLMQPQ